ncbi:MAG: TolC family protein [Endomicrobium sp.]|jgi:outer membrane protein TolC|nr:TolC family protein [Endomicrobium sp.]
MKKILSAAAIIFVSSNLSAADLSLQDALRAALENHPKIMQAKQNYEKASYQASAAKAAYLPRVDITALAVKINEPITLDLNNIRSAIIKASAASYAASGGANPSAFTAGLESQTPFFEKKIVDDAIARAVATFAQPIFTGFKISANAAVKKLEKEAARILLQNAKNSVSAEVIEDYYRTKLAYQIVKIRNDLQNNIENHAVNAKKLFSSGIISKANLLRYEVALAEAKKDYQKSVMDAELAAALLLNSVGNDAENKELSSPMEILRELDDKAVYEKKAENNCALKLLEAKKEMLEQKRKAAWGNLLPAAAVAGQYQILQNNLTIAEPEWALGITVSMNVFGGGKDYNEIKASYAEISAVNAEISAAKKFINTAVKNFYNRCLNAKRECEALDSARELALENLKLYCASFKEGLATSLEVVDAELALAKIKADREKAVFEYNSSYANLLSLCDMQMEE